MRHGLRRAAAERLCHVLERILPPRHRDWARAIAAEVDAIPDDGDALRFALHGFCGLVPRAAALRLHRPFPSPADAGSSRSMSDMTLRSSSLAFGIACAIGAVLLGLAYLALAGAPARYLGINGGALVIGLLLVALTRDAATRLSLPPGIIALALSFVLLAATLAADGAAEAARWVRIAGISIQPSLILVPAIIIGFASVRSRAAAIATIVAAATLALQPDRAMAGVLAAALAVLACTRRDRGTLAALAAALAGFVATLLQPDRFPPAPHVDQILYTAFDVHPLAGACVLAGAVVMLLPAAAGLVAGRGASDAHLAFGALWGTVILAAALGNYPTPLVGYGGSAVIGYLVSLSLLPTMRPRGDCGRAATITAPAEPDAAADARTGLAAAA
ncbi:hypothetical protein TPR58_22120 [Sphingomonas sp. HF-S3]|uniref:Cell wall polymerase n=1 Tax=Sphingomonas rustica TaxID=3103142 RepID=A0ABV0BEB1_9SPHN